jgi:hypothetical protein
MKLVSLSAQVDINSPPSMLSVAWQPGGAMLAVPAVDNQVALLERVTWEPSYYLRGVHSAPVQLISFSPNGEVKRRAAAECMEVMRRNHCLTALYMP